MNFELNTEPTFPWSASGVGPPALAAVALLLVGLTVWSYAGVRGATVRRVAAVLALRLAALLLAFLAVLRPALAFRSETKAPSLLIVAVDDSESMSIQDEFDGQSRWERLRRALHKCEPELRRLRDDYNVTVAFHRFSTGVRPFDPADDAAQADGKRSDYGLMLHTLHERYRGERALRGLLVLGDGADNGTRHEPLAAAGQLRSLPCPVHTFGFGKTTTGDRQSDVAVTGITAEPSPVPVKGKLTLKATVDAPGFENRTVKVRLFIDDKPVPVLVGDQKQDFQEARLALTAGNEVAVVTDAPDKPGEIKVTLKVEPLPDELTPFNNEISTFVTVSKEGLSVLYVDKLRPERHFLSDQALATDPRIRVDYVVLGSPQAPAPTAEPLTQFEQRNYDVIILGDVTADEVKAVNPKASEIIKEKANKGAGVLMIGGRRNFGNGGWEGTELAKVLPVTMSPNLGEVSGDVTIEPTVRGKEHYLLRLADDPAENAQVWRKLPLRDGMSRMGPVKANVAAVLLKSAAGDDVLVAGEFGAGRTAAFAGDTTYLWLRPKEAPYYVRFWRQLVLWLARQEDTEGSVWVRPDARRLAAGSRLGFSTGVRSKGGLDLKGAVFDAKVIGPDGAEAPVPTARDRDEDRGTFWKTDAPGEYRLVVKGRAKDADGQEVSGEASSRFLVYQDDAEMARRAADHEFLKRLAAAGGGRFHPGDEEELARYLHDLPSQPLAGWRPKANLWPDWRRSSLSAFPPAFLAVFVAMVSLEWFLRRRWGLV